MRRFEDIAFDHYGYFSQDIPLTSTTTTSTTPTVASTTAFTVTLPPVSAGNLFVSDLASGLSSVTVTSVANGTAGQPGYIPAGISVTAAVPVQGPGSSAPAAKSQRTLRPGQQSAGGGLQSGEGNPSGGRIIQITPQGVVSDFAQGLLTPRGVLEPELSSVVRIDSELSITFSADGTTLWASDDQGIWQFKTTASLADSTTGTLIGLNDLRTLGVPYDGQGSAVAVVDTGVDGQSPPFRGRVTTGTNIWTGGPGNQDLAANAGGGTTETTLVNTFDGHGTPVAGVVAQFVPQATIEPVTIFAPFIGSVTLQTSSSSTPTPTPTPTPHPPHPHPHPHPYSHPYTYSHSHPHRPECLVQCPDHQPSGLRRLEVRCEPPLRERPGTSRQGRPRDRIDPRLRYNRDLHQRIHSLQAVSPDRHRAQEPVAQAPQAGHRSDRGVWPVWRSAGGYEQHEYHGHNSGHQQATSARVQQRRQRVAGRCQRHVAASRLERGHLGHRHLSVPVHDQSLDDSVRSSRQCHSQPARSRAGLRQRADHRRDREHEHHGHHGTTTSNTAGVAANVLTYTAADTLMYNDRITGAANRSATTDFAAPAIDVPTFRRTFSLVNVPSGTSTSAAGDPNDHLTFSQVGTSMSSAIVTGAYSLVASALNYWITLTQANGVTSDAYLTTPVGVDSLNFGAHAIKNLSVYNNPDGINGILAYTAVPAADVNDAGSLSTPPLLGTHDKQNNYTGTTVPPSYARVSVGNAIASIEGTIAINYLLSHNDFPLIDANGDGIITAQELQNFTDTAASKGLAEAGAMAALLGGTATYAQPEAGINNTVFNENPDQPAALQRRFNYFDYLANGQLKGGISISSFKMLANTLLPQPDAYVIVDRQRASANGFLVAPLAQRNFVNLQHLAAEVHVRASRRRSRSIATSRRRMFGVNKNDEARNGLAFLLAVRGRFRQRDDGNPRGRDGHGQRTDLLGLHGSSPARIVLEHADHDHNNDTDYALREHGSDDNEHDCDDNEHDSGDREHDCRRPRARLR